MADYGVLVRTRFRAVERGGWAVRSQACVSGEPLPRATGFDIVDGNATATGDGDAAFTLEGVHSHARYAARAEIDRLSDRHSNLGRREASHAALIPVRKSQDWWLMAQDERRHVMEEQSRHISMSLDYLPMISRRLYHSRDLGEPFDFLTWFEYAPEHEALFDELVDRLRASPEWRYVEREVDFRLVRRG